MLLSQEVRFLKDLYREADQMDRLPQGSRVALEQDLGEAISDSQYLVGCTCFA